jgi:hypothetical protein
MISSPTDFPQLDVAAEWDRLNSSLHDLIDRGLVSLTKLPDATLASLQRPLRLSQYNIFHFIGHGGFDEQSQDGALVLEDAKGRGHLVSGQDLGIMVSGHRALRLVILNACEGARSSTSDPFAGVAQALIQQAIPAVIAMQFEITDDAAITFAHEFYGALADGYPVDATLAESRRAIFAQGNEFEWATPVLYMRSPNGQLFRLTRRSSLALEEAGERETAQRVGTEHADVERAERELAEHDRAQRHGAAIERAERAPGESADVSRPDRAELGAASVEPARLPGAAPARERPAGRSWPRRHARLTLGAMVIAIVASGAIIATQVAGGGQPRTTGSDPEYQALLKLLPASIQPRCQDGRNVAGQNWMIKGSGALAQCTSNDFPYYLTYGLWPSPSGARDFAAYGLGSDVVPCATSTIKAMKTILPRATRTCGDQRSGNDKGIFMVWNENGSRVAAWFWWSTQNQGDALNHLQTVAQAS